MTVNELSQILREIVMTWPYDECNQVDTYAHLGDLSRLERSDLGMNRSDFVDGVFWSRKYVNSGKEKMTSDFPKLVMDIESYDLLCCDTNIVISVWDKEKCVECGCQKNELDVKRTIFSILRQAYLKLLTYSLRKDGNGDIIWTRDTSLELVGELGRIGSHIRDYNLETEVINYGHSGLYFAQITFSIKGNCSKNVNFTSFQDVPEIGKIKCDTCG